MPAAPRNLIGIAPFTCPLLVPPGSSPSVDRSRASRGKAKGQLRRSDDESTFEKISETTTLTFRELASAFSSLHGCDGCCSKQQPCCYCSNAGPSRPRTRQDKEWVCTVGKAVDMAAGTVGDMAMPVDKGMAADMLSG